MGHGLARIFRRMTGTLGLDISHRALVLNVYTLGSREVPKRYYAL